MKRFLSARLMTAILASLSASVRRSSMLTLILFTAGGEVVAQVSEFEATTDLNAEDILPPELLRGKHHVVDDRVRNDGYLNYYTIRSDFGEFEAVSTMMLRTRIGEINALAELDELSKTEVFVKAAADAGVKQLRSLKAFATKPVETVKGIPRGIGRMFKRYKRQAGEAVDSTQEYLAEDEEESGNGDEEDDSNKAVDLTESYLGVDKAHRAWSRKLGTDPYSSNKVLHDAINEVAWAERLGRIGMGFAGVPKIPGADIIGDVNEAVWSKDPYELKDLNRARLVATGADEALIEQYLDNPRMTPTQQTIYTAAIAELADVAGRDGMLRQALLPDTEAESGFLIRSAVLLAWYHINSQPIVSVKTNAVLPAGVTNNGKTVVLAPVDHLYWTDTTAEAAADFAKFADREQHLEAWLLGSASDRCRAELEAAGIEVHANAAALLDEGEG